MYGLLVNSNEGRVFLVTDCYCLMIGARELRATNLVVQVHGWSWRLVSNLSMLDLITIPVSTCTVHVQYILYGMN